MKRIHLACCFALLSSIAGNSFAINSHTHTQTAADPNHVYTTLKKEIEDSTEFAPYIKRSILPTTPLQNIDPQTYLVVMLAENKFNIEIPEDKAKNFKTVGDLVNFIKTHQNK